MKIQPIRLLIIYLAILAVAGSVSWVWGTPLRYVQQVLNYLLLFGAMYASGFLICRIQKKPMPRMEDRMITSLILFLLFDSFQPFWVFALLGVVTETLQRVVRVTTGPVFNPAALGALLVSILGFLPSWWGASFSPRIPLTADGVSVAALLTYIAAAFITWKYKKYWIALVAAVLTCVMYLVLFQYSPLFLLLEGTLAFYLMVMAVEPKTSPILRNEQIAFGVVIGFVLPVLLKLGFLEAYAGALLLANGIFQLYRYQSRKRMMSRAAVPPATAQPTL